MPLEIALCQTIESKLRKASNLYDNLRSHACFSMQGNNAWGQDPGSWVVHDPGPSGHITCNIPFWPLLGLVEQIERPHLIRELVMSNHSTYISLIYILQIALMANKHPTLFILKVLEGSDWKSTLSRETVFENYFYQFINTHEVNQNYFF